MTPRTGIVITFEEAVVAIETTASATFRAGTRSHDDTLHREASHSAAAFGFNRHALYSQAKFLAEQKTHQKFLADHFQVIHITGKETA